MVLKLEAITIYNFKSFKGIHSITGLNDHFTAIVGPNGSGKSNIIDSILFVLGFKAKKMRHAVLKDLINVGASDAYVELRFNQFVLRRSLKGRMDSSDNLKNVISKYELNGKEEQSNDIIQYLKEKGIDLDNNRFLILQGEIETIAMMNPLELLEYIEDCIGTSAFKPRIDTLDLEIKNKQEEVDGLINNLKFIESDYLFKKGRRDCKIDFLAFRNESLVMKDRIVDLKAEIACRREQSCITEKESIEKRLVQTVAENKTSNERIKKLERSVEKLNLPIKEQELTLFRNEFLRIQRDNKTNEARAARIERALEKAKVELEENQQAISNWDREFKQLNRSFKENTSEITDLESKLKNKTSELDKFSEIKQLESKKAHLEKKLLELMNQREEYLKEGREIMALEERLNFLSNAIGNAGDIKGFEIEKGQLEQEVAGIRRDMESTNQEIARRRRRQEENDFLEQSYRREKEVSENLKSVPGVYGFVKDLGSYDRKYDEAVEAATKALTNIVVDTSKTAEQCIAIINKKKLNRTTFVILDKLNGPESVEFPKEKGAELLFKKIKCAPEFNKLFYFVFKDTLCVPTLEEARELAFGRTRQRVVTLDGKLLEKSGVMSGGKVSKKLKSAAELEEIYKNMMNILNLKAARLSELRALENQRMQATSNAKELERLEKELSVRKRSSKANSSALSELDLQIASARTDLDGFDLSLPPKAVEIKNEIKALYEKINGLQKINQEIKIALGNEPGNNRAVLTKEISKLEKELRTISLEDLPDNKILKQLEDEFNALYAQQKEMEDQISVIRSKMGEKYHEEAQMKAQVEELQDGLNECGKVRQNCAQKKNEILNEYTMTSSLLNQIAPDRVIPLDAEPLATDEMDDRELKAMSKVMIEELSRKESENFKKLKDSDGNEAVEEDLEVYRIIFTGFNQSKKIYDEIKTSTDFNSNQLVSMKSELEELKNQRLKLFLDGYTAINKNIKEIFSLITFGGNAELDLLDYLNPFTEGIVLNIMPPKKAWKQISNLSGGEKTLSSLGLIFALHKFKPSCLYIMDEIDAALDFKNVSVISQYLAHVQSQFIIISLRNDMFEMAKTLIGVYKYENASKAITVDLEALEKIH